MYYFNCNLNRTWIDDFIYNTMQAKYKVTRDEVQFNLENDRKKNLDYLGTYFPRSLCEYYWIFENLSQNKIIKNNLASSEIINILSVGTGTGGEVIGTILYLCSINSEKNIKQINITTVESNQDAIELFNKIIKK